MSLTRCPYCEHGNPADSKFCSECGGALHLVPCPGCGAVSEITATVCYQCRARLPGRGTDATVPTSPAAEISRSLPRPPFRVIVGAAVLAVVAVLGYYTNRQLSLNDAPRAPAASSEASGPGAPAVTRVIRRDAAAGDTKTDQPDNSAGLASPAASASGTQLAAPERDAANQPRASRQPEYPQKAKTAATLTTRPQTINTGGAREQRPSRPEACTEAVAALRLCATIPVQSKAADSAAAVDAVIQRPQRTDAGKAGGQEPPRPQPCTEAVAALGLCTLESTQRRE